MSDNELSHDTANKWVKGYEIKKAIVFTDNRGFALAENPNAVQPFVTWQFTEDEYGKREYYWGHYMTDGEAAKRDYKARTAGHQKDYGVSERPARPVQDNYHYYAKYPLDIGTFPKTPGGPIHLEPFDKRELVEGGTFQAWGILTYNEPLTDRQITEYELRAASDNPRLAYEQYDQQVQTVGKWEQSKRIPDEKRLTWWHPDFGVFVKNNSATATQITERYKNIADRQKAKPSIADQLAKGTEQAEKDNAARPAPGKKTEKDR